MKQTLKIGHRGAKAYVAENTLASIEKALELGVDGIEIDVHLCASGELVVFHDFTLDRMTNGSGELSKFTIQELKALKVETLHNIPTLDEVLNLVNKRCLVNIELKGLHTAKPVLKQVEYCIRTHKWSQNQFIISSFQFEELKIVYNNNPELRLAVLTKASVSEAVKRAKQIKAFAIHPNMALLTKDNVREAQQKGFQVNVWTVNEDSDIDRMKSYGVDGIISDNPDRI